ncbi:MAG: hypothetical protein AB3N16_08495, partial [Flavobacteriaceae bacterium]
MRKTLLLYDEITKREIALGWQVTIILSLFLLMTESLNARDMASPSFPTSDDTLTAATIEGGTLTGGPFTFCVGDGYPDHVEGVTVSGDNGSYGQWVVTDEQGTILG